MADQVIPPCPVCGRERIRKTSHTAKNPDRDFVFCSQQHKEAWAWVDQLTPKYEFIRPLVTTDAERNARIDARMKEFNAKINPSSFEELSSSNEASDKLMKAVGDNSSKGDGAESVVATTQDNPLSFLNIAPVVATRQEFVPSPYQEAIFDFVKGDNGNAVVEAVAGSGKTSTLVRALDITPHSASVAFLAFNRHIAAELRDRVPDNVHVSTLHSLGFLNARNALGDKLRVNEYKLWDLWDELDPYGDLYALKPNVIKVVDLLKATLREPTKDNLDYLIDRYNIEVDGDLDKFYELSPQLYAKSLREKNELDFGDMIHWSAIGDIPCQKFDFVYSDESQDYNAAQRRIIFNSVREGGRVIAVGDRKQSIMGFQGSDTESIPNFISELDARILPLSICYRCHKGAVRLAQKLVPQIEWRADAVEGITEDIAELKNMQAGDMVLCRTNAPLVEPCFALIREGVKATIRGRDIGNGLIAMLTRGEKKALSKNVADVFNYLNGYVRQEVSKLIRQRKEVRAASLQDQLETLYALSEDCKTSGDVKRKINQVFSDEKSSVVFSSQHRAKGLEADRVFILRPELNPFPKAEQAWEMEQELNLLYVAITRPKKELYFVGERPALLH